MKLTYKWKVISTTNVSCLLLILSLRATSMSSLAAAWILILYLSLSIRRWGDNLGWLAYLSKVSAPIAPKLEHHIKIYLVLCWQTKVPPILNNEKYPNQILVAVGEWADNRKTIMLSVFYSTYQCCLAFF